MEKSVLGVQKKLGYHLKVGIMFINYNQISWSTMTQNPGLEGIKIHTAFNKMETNFMLQKKFWEIETGIGLISLGFCAHFSYDEFIP